MNWAVPLVHMHSERNISARGCWLVLWDEAIYKVPAGWTSVEEERLVCLGEIWGVGHQGKTGRLIQ